MVKYPLIQLTELPGVSFNQTKDTKDSDHHNHHLNYFLMTMQGMAPSSTYFR